ncbi:flagellar biosynthetic protein FliO [Ramlibacter pallidus]|uniref:Flagellar biosynthetic protein FliO n=1 Tax=Ramlibacter pallidus TaxID=2780087 RepID=A0ABR9S154_9BURK|nr:flagellar biosynthetic protein FliO [Ramlibacter pallidus]MBE7367184.1 flagellar biosynthetic protein FliO [Ramlibacter pallidus]
MHQARSRRKRWFLAAAVVLQAGAASPTFAQVAQQPQASASAPAPAGLPKDLPLRRDPPASGDGAPWTAAVVLGLLAIGAMAVVVRRRGAGALLGGRGTVRPTGAQVAKLASLPLTPQASVHAVRWDGEELLLGCTAQQVTVLARRPAPGPVEVPQ